MKKLNRKFRVMVAGLAVALVSVGVPAYATHDTPLFQSFTSATKLVTNEYAYWNPTSSTRVVSPDWEMTSGSLFTRSGNGYTGVPDDVSPNAQSSAGTNSAVFRLNTKNYTFTDVDVSMNLNIARQVSTPSTPSVAWDGVHVFLRYQSQYHLYYASVARRDGKVVIKKKCPGGSSNSGTYYTLNGEKSGFAFSTNTWTSFSTSVKNNSTGSVTINLYRNGTLIHTATDAGTGCAAIRTAGATGIRGDNTEFDFNNFVVKPLPV